MKEFNITGLCVPRKHYMVDVSAKIAGIKVMIDEGKYFAINRGRQYGKTTAFAAIASRLSKYYTVLNISFESLGDSDFAEEGAFIRVFSRIVASLTRLQKLETPYFEELAVRSDEKIKRTVFLDLSEAITELCTRSDKPVILLIDEVDQAAGYKVFLKFLGLLREKYLARGMSNIPTFQSVILAGVYDIRNLKLKLRPDEMHQYNSPWNIASDFEVDMSFNPAEIATMLQDYENDHHTGMDIPAISDEIHRFTNGYPYLVSAVCKIIDEKLNRDWQVSTVNQAVKHLLNTRNTLFDDLTKKVSDNNKLRDIIYSLLIAGDSIAYSPMNDAIDLGIRFGILQKHENGKCTVAVSNSIFENCLYSWLSENTATLIRPEAKVTSLYVKNGILNMETVLQKFAEFMHSEHRDSDEKFVEQNARLLFLSFLKPIINGTGSYYVEAETRDYQRMDVVVFYERKEYIIELKIWRGEKLNNEAYDQLCGYLDSRRQEKGYLLNFCFNKNADSLKELNTGWFNHNGKQIFAETVVFSK